jgi:hypothetical protein
MISLMQCMFGYPLQQELEEILYHGLVVSKEYYYVDSLAALECVSVQRDFLVYSKTSPA